MRWVYACSTCVTPIRGSWVNGEVGIKWYEEFETGLKSFEWLELVIWNKWWLDSKKQAWTVNLKSNVIHFGWKLIHYIYYKLWKKGTTERCQAWCQAWHHMNIFLVSGWILDALMICKHLGKSIEEFALGIDPKSLHATVLMQMVYNAVVQHSGRFLKYSMWQ